MNSRDILQELLRYPTVSSESNLAMMRWIERYLTAYGVKVRLLLDEDGLDKASLLAKFGEGEGGLVFSGHSDVVPVEGQPWSHSPFELYEEGGRLFGRGACDMKGFLASSLALVPRLCALSEGLKRPVYWAFSYDEEVGCDKAPRLAKALLDWGAKGAYVLVGEPTLLAPVIGQKGIVNVRTVITGQEAHSSQILHQGLSAVHLAGQWISYVEKVMFDLQAEGRVNGDYSVPHSSLHVGMVHGGIAHNVLARECVLDWEIRNLPEDDMEMLLAKVNAYEEALCARYPKLAIKTAFSSVVVPALRADASSAFLRLIQKLRSEAPQYVAYATEAGHFQAMGFDTIICGPGSILQAHQADEWIAVEQLSACDDLLWGLVKAHCAVF